MDARTQAHELRMQKEQKAADEQIALMQRQIEQQMSANRFL